MEWRPNMHRPYVLLASSVLLGCGDSTILPMEDGSVPDAGPACTDDESCDDFLFCTGVERCEPTSPEADARGCASTPACTFGQECEEATRTCAATICEDRDGDGALANRCGGVDCDDDDMSRRPGTPEICNAVDEDCDTTTFGDRDADGDGYPDIGCCNMGPEGPVCGTDCDDADAASHPTEAENCDGTDNDCDGYVDEASLLTFYRDIDGDGYGVTSMTRAACGAPPGYAVNPGDCDDSRAAVHPGARDECNELDDDCDGTPDLGCTCTIGRRTECGEGDGMGGFLMIGLCHPGTQDCIAGEWGACVGAVRPASESCNASDDDCDGTTDEGVTNTYYRDVDGDGYGSSASVAACAAPTGYVLVPGDCDDTTRATHPTATEICNGADDDCSGTADEGVTSVFYRDADMDGYGGATSSRACSAPIGYVAMSGDCDDGNRLVRPGVSDGCDMIDNNCDGTTDPGCACVDGRTQACGTSDGMGGFLRRGICVPGSQTCMSGAWGMCMGDVAPVPETCNALDDDCDGTADDGVLTSYYRDCDRDGFGARGSVATSGCMPPATPPTCGATTGVWVSNNADCNDGSSTVRPGASETCNSIDDDCDGVTDGAPATTWCNGAGRPPHAASATCTGGVCHASSCDAMFLDCSAAAGCETAWSRTDCGACGGSCAWGGCLTSGECDDAIAVDVGTSHGCALHERGAVSCWGSNGSGKLGDGTTTARTTPVMVTGVTDAVELSAGGQHTCVRRMSGAVLCWGDNNDGQLGDGTTTDRHTPVAVSGLTDAVEIVAGDDHTCARRASGVVVCWGNNVRGQLGDGTTTARSAPTAVSGLIDAVEISAGNYYTCARRTGGTVKCWGQNAGNQLGDGAAAHTICTPLGPDIDCSLVPVTVSGLSDAIEISSSICPQSNCGHSCARRATGSVVCWGSNTRGQLGDGTTLPRTTPVGVAGVADATSIIAGAESTCALRPGGAVSCWGMNILGQLGNGSMIDSVTPVAVSGLMGATQVASDGWFACALRGGSVVGWGDNRNGQLGDGTTTNRLTPVATSPPP
jgi:alpha-tubulin suppressor-like RCC1 family protein